MRKSRSPRNSPALCDAMPSSPIWWPPAGRSAARAPGTVPQWTVWSRRAGWRPSARAITAADGGMLFGPAWPLWRAAGDGLVRRDGLGVHLLDQAHEAAQRLDALGRRLALRVDLQRRDPGGAVDADPLAHHRLRAEQVRFQHELVGNQRGGLLALAVEPAILHPLHQLGVALPRIGVLVEVALARAHRADLKGEPRLARRDQAVEVVAERHHAAGHAVDRVEAAAGPLGAAAQRREEDLGVLRHEGAGDPAVRQLARHLQALRAERGEVDRDLRRRGAAPECPPLAAGQRQLVDRALVRRSLAAR